MILSHEDRAEKKELYERLRERFEQIGLHATQVLGSYRSRLPPASSSAFVIGISTLLNPKVVVADEPTSALDVSTQKSGHSLLFDLMDRGIVSSMLFITHELPLFCATFSSSIVVMYAGEFVEVGKTERIIQRSEAPYRSLMSSMLSAEPGQRGRKPVAIEVPRPTWPCHCSAVDSPSGARAWGPSVRRGTRRSASWPNDK